VPPIGADFTLFERDCKGPRIRGMIKRQPFSGVRGVPEKSLFLLLLAAGGEREKKKPGFQTCP